MAFTQGRFDLALGERSTGSFAAAAQRWHDGTLAVRDGFLLVGIDVVNEPDRVLRIKPGVTLPIGAVSSGLAISPLTTGSFDPWLQVDALYGGTWVGGVTGTLRAPISQGSDGVRQGVRARADLKLARRTARGVGWLGWTTVAQGTGERSGRTGVELSAAGGWVAELNDSWALGLDVRVPVWNRTTQGVPYVVSAGLTISRVNAPEAEDEDEDHHGGDGHDHGH